MVGLATPNAMKPYVESGCVKSVVLWNPVDLGYAAVYVMRAVVDGKLQARRHEVEAGRLGKLQVVNGSEVLLGAALHLHQGQHRRLRLLRRGGRAASPDDGPLTRSGRPRPAHGVGLVEPRAQVVTTSASVVAGGVLRERWQRTTPSMITMLMPGQIAHADALQERLAGGVLGAIHEHEVGRPAGLDQAAVELAHARGVAGREAERRRGVDLAEAAEQRDRAQNAERLDAGAGRRIGPQDDPLRLTELDRRAHGVERGERVAVVHDLDRRGCTARRGSGSG